MIESFLRDDELGKSCSSRRSPLRTTMGAGASRLTASPEVGFEAPLVGQESMLDGADIDLDDLDRILGRSCRDARVSSIWLTSGPPSRRYNRVTGSALPLSKAAAAAAARSPASSRPPHRERLPPQRSGVRKIPRPRRSIRSPFGRSPRAHRRDRRSRWRRLRLDPRVSAGDFTGSPTFQVL